MIKKDEFNKDLYATYEQNTKTVTITLTAIEVFAIVSAVQLSEHEIPALGPLMDCAKKSAKKMHACLDPNSLLSQHLNRGWE